MPRLRDHISGDNYLDTHRVRARVVDQYENPVSNVDISFYAADVLEHAQGTCAVVDERPTLLIPAGHPCLESSMPVYGDCPDASRSLDAVTGHLGAYACVMLGGEEHIDSLTGMYPIEANAHELGLFRNDYVITAYGSYIMPESNYTPHFAYMHILKDTNSDWDQQGKLVNSRKVGEPVSIVNRMIFLEESAISSQTYSYTCEGMDIPQKNCSYCPGPFEVDTEPLFNIEYGGENVSSRISVYKFLDPYNPDWWNSTYIGDAIYIGSGYFNFDYNVEPGKNYLYFVPVGVTLADWIEYCPDGTTCVTHFQEPVKLVYNYPVVFRQFYGVDILTEDNYLVAVDEYNRSKDDLVIEYEILPAEYESAQSAYLAVYEDDVPVQYISCETSGTGTATISRGSLFDPSKEYTAKVILNAGTSWEIISDSIDIFIKQFDIDLVSHFPGTLLSPGQAIEESNEDIPENNVILVNSDYDENDFFGRRDNKNALVWPADNDVVAIDIRKTSKLATFGKFVISVFPENSCRFFSSDGIQIDDLSVDFSDPSGPLSSLINSDIVIYIESLMPHYDIIVRGTYLNNDGKVLSSDDVHFFSSFNILLKENIVIATVLQNTSGSDMPDPEIHGEGVLAYCDDDNPYWIYNEPGILLREGELASDAIDHIFISGESYRYDCTSAAFLVWYKSILETFRECEKDDAESAFICDLENGISAVEVYDENFDVITIAGAISVVNIPYIPYNKYDDYYVGDCRYIKNPACDLDQFPQWQGENVFQISDLNCSCTDIACIYNELFYGFPLGKYTFLWWYGFMYQRTDPELLEEKGYPYLMDEASRLDSVGLVKMLYQVD